MRMIDWVIHIVFDGISESRHIPREKRMELSSDTLHSRRIESIKKYASSEDPPKDREKEDCEKYISKRIHTKECFSL